MPDTEPTTAARQPQEMPSDYYKEEIHSNRLQNLPPRRRRLVEVESVYFQSRACIPSISLDLRTPIHQNLLPQRVWEASWKTTKSRLNLSTMTEKTKIRNLKKKDVGFGYYRHVCLVWMGLSPSRPVPMTSRMLLLPLLKAT
jgi:hypothetical protein